MRRWPSTLTWRVTRTRLTIGRHGKYRSVSCWVLSYLSILLLFIYSFVRSFVCLFVHLFTLFIGYYMKYNKNTFVMRIILLTEMKTTELFFSCSNNKTWLKSMNRYCFTCTFSISNTLHSNLLLFTILFNYALKSVSVFGLPVGIFSSRFGICCRLFKILRYQFGNFGISLCVKALRADPKILLPSHAVRGFWPKISLRRVCISAALTGGRGIASNPEELSF